MEIDVSGQKITRQQEELYMQHRQKGCNQKIASAKAGISKPSGRRINKAGGSRPTRTRHDPLGAVWESELLPLLQAKPSLTGTTLLEYLLDHYPEHYDQAVLRALQRRVKQWRAIEGLDKDIIFRQDAAISMQRFSDFSHQNETVLINEEPFDQLFYQFRFAFIGCLMRASSLIGESMSLVFFRTPSPTSQMWAVPSLKERRSFCPSGTGAHPTPTAILIA